MTPDDPYRCVLKEGHKGGHRFRVDGHSEADPRCTAPPSPIPRWEGDDEAV